MRQKREKYNFATLIVGIFMFIVAFKIMAPLYTSRPVIGRIVEMDPIQHHLPEEVSDHSYYFTTAKIQVEDKVYDYYFEYDEKDEFPDIGTDMQLALLKSGELTNYVPRTEITIFAAVFFGIGLQVILSSLKVQKKRVDELTNREPKY